MLVKKGLKRHFLTLAIFVFANTVWANDSSDKQQLTYQNMGCNYQVNLPTNSRLITNLSSEVIKAYQDKNFMLGVTQENFLKSFSFNPSCAIHVALPVEQNNFNHIKNLYLDVVRLDDASKELKLKPLTKRSLGFYPPNQSIQFNPSPKTIKLNGKQFNEIGVYHHKNNTHKETFMYFYYHNQAYYVLSFVADGDNIANLATEQQNDDKQTLQQYINSILKSFQITQQ